MKKRQKQEIWANTYVCKIRNLHRVSKLVTNKNAKNTLDKASEFIEHTSKN